MSQTEQGQMMAKTNTPMVYHEVIKTKAELFAKKLIEEHPELNLVTINFGWLTQDQTAPQAVVQPRATNDEMTVQHLLQLAEAGLSNTRHTILALVRAIRRQAMQIPQPPQDHVQAPQPLSGGVTPFQFKPATGEQVAPLASQASEHLKSLVNGPTHPGSGDVQVGDPQAMIVGQITPVKGEKSTAEAGEGAKDTQAKQGEKQPSAEDAPDWNV